MNTFLTSLAQLSSAITNSLVSLDAVTRARLTRLEGRSIRFETLAPADVINVAFVRGTIVVEDRAQTAPGVIVRGTASDLLEAFLRGDLGTGSLEISGDELLLSEFVEIARNLRPDIEGPLARIVGERSAQNLVGFMEYGFETLGRIARDLGAEGSRLAKREARRRYVDRTDLDHLHERRHAVALRMDRVAARLDLLDKRDAGS